MKAIQMTDSGGPEVLQLVDLPEPAPGPGEIKVRLRAAGVNPVDTKLRSRGVFFENAAGYPGLRRRRHGRAGRRGRYDAHSRR
jgi:NADPH:quinone reductase-like Zn-dependent oxidoreductase